MAFAAMHSCYHVPLHNQNMVTVYEDGKKEQKKPLQNKKEKNKIIKLRKLGKIRTFNCWTTTIGKFLTKDKKNEQNSWEYTCERTSQAHKILSWNIKNFRIWYHLQWHNLKPITNGRQQTYCYIHLKNEHYQHKITQNMQLIQWIESN